VAPLSIETGLEHRMRNTQTSVSADFFVWSPMPSVINACFKTRYLSSPHSVVAEDAIYAQG
jgi:hypothetical protein